MTHHTYCRLRLFQCDIIDQRFVLAISRFHLYEKHFTRDAREAWNLNVNGIANFAFNRLLCGRWSSTFRDVGRSPNRPRQAFGNVIM